MCVCLVGLYMVHPYSSMDLTAAWKKLRFILSDRCDFHVCVCVCVCVCGITVKVLDCDLVLSEFVLYTDLRPGQAVKRRYAPV